MTFFNTVFREILSDPFMMAPMGGQMLGPTQQMSRMVRMMDSMVVSDLSGMTGAGRARRQQCPVHSQAATKQSRQVQTGRGPPQPRQKPPPPVSWTVKPSGEAATVPTVLSCPASAAHCRCCRGRGRGAPVCAREAGSAHSAPAQRNFCPPSQTRGRELLHCTATNPRDCSARLEGRRRRSVSDSAARRERKAGRARSVESYSSAPLPLESGGRRAGGRGSSRYQRANTASKKQAETDRSSAGSSNDRISEDDETSHEEKPYRWKKGLLWILSLVCVFLTFVLKSV